jgi:hypothetical protein
MFNVFAHQSGKFRVENTVLKAPKCTKWHVVVKKKFRPQTVSHGTSKTEGYGEGSGREWSGREDGTKGEGQEEEGNGECGRQVGGRREMGE